MTLFFLFRLLHPFLLLLLSFFFFFSFNNNKKEQLGESPPFARYTHTHSRFIPGAARWSFLGGGRRTSFLARHTVGRSADRVVKSSKQQQQQGAATWVERASQKLLLPLLLFFSCLDKLPKWISKSSDPKPFGGQGKKFRTTTNTNNDDESDKINHLNQTNCATIFVIYWSIFKFLAHHIDVAFWIVDCSSKCQ